MVLSPGLFSRSAVDVLKWTDDWVERDREGGITMSSSSSVGVSIDRLLGLRIPGLRNVGSTGIPGMTGGCGRGSRGNRIIMVMDMDSRSRAEVLSHNRRNLWFAAIVQVKIQHAYSQGWKEDSGSVPSSPGTGRGLQ